MQQSTSVTVIDAGNQQTDTAEKGKQQQRYNRHLRQSVCSLALAVKSASQSQFEQRRLTAQQQVRMGSFCCRPCWGGWLGVPQACAYCQLALERPPA